MGTGTESVVYFIKDESTGHVKIGTTRNFRSRFLTLQNGCAGILTPLGVIPRAGKRIERALHRQFSDCRIEGEWFQLSPYLAQYIIHNTKAVDRPVIENEGWGGKRSGAGRPKDSGDFPRQLAVRLTEEQYQFVMSQDEGAAAFVRRLIDAEQERKPGRPPKP